jgi:hypothetical protein
MGRSRPRLSIVVLPFANLSFRAEAANEWRIAVAAA